MMKILHVTSSPRGQASESYRLSQKIISCLLKREPTAIVVNRVIGGGAISHIDASYATALGATQQSSAESSPQGSMSRSEELIQELESSDVLVIGTPMHNFTVPSALKAWIDHIVRVRRTFNATTKGYVGTLRDRPVFVAVSSGGRYSGEQTGGWLEPPVRMFWHTFWTQARTPAGFSHAVPKSDLRHHRTARSDFLLN